MTTGRSHEGTPEERQRREDEAIVAGIVGFPIFENREAAERYFAAVKRLSTLSTLHAPEVAAVKDVTGTVRIVRDALLRICATFDALLSCDLTQAAPHAERHAAAHALRDLRSLADAKFLLETAIASKGSTTPKSTPTGRGRSDG